MVPEDLGVERRKEHTGAVGSRTAHADNAPISIRYGNVECRIKQRQGQCPLSLALSWWKRFMVSETGRHPCFCVDSSYLL